MRRIVLALLLLAGNWGVGAPTPFPTPDRRTDVDKLQGDWMLARLPDGLGAGRATDLMLFVEGRNCRFLGRGWGVLNLDARSEPKRMDFTFRQSEPILCIYRLDGDTLTVRMGDEKVCPPDFESKAKRSGHQTLVFERERGR